MIVRNHTSVKKKIPFSRCVFQMCCIEYAPFSACLHENMAGQEACPWHFLSRRVRFFESVETLIKVPFP